MEQTVFYNCHNNNLSTDFEYLQSIKHREVWFLCKVCIVFLMTLLLKRLKRNRDGVSHNIIIHFLCTEERDSVSNNIIINFLCIEERERWCNNYHSFVLCYV